MADDRRLQHFRTLLQQRERELAELLGARTGGDDPASGVLAPPGPVDAGDDMSQVDELRDDAFAQIQVHDRELAQVRQALTRMEQGEYGDCIDCGEPIPEARLEAEPWALRCIADQEAFERRAAGGNAQVPGSRTM